jgi:serine/threonine-protein kinase HipA
MKRVPRSGKRKSEKKALQHFMILIFCQVLYDESRMGALRFKTDPNEFRQINKTASTHHGHPFRTAKRAANFENDIIRR